MKQIKRMLAVVLAVLMIAVSVPYAFAAPSLNYTSKAIYYGQTLQLKVNGGTASAWKSSNKAVVAVNAKGVIKGVGLGTATIKAAVGKKVLACKIAVKDRNVTAAVSFKSSTGGVFINNVNEAVIGVKPLKYNVAKAAVYVLDAAETVVYKTVLTRLTKNQGVYPHWNGRTNKGAVVPSGTYTVYVKIGKTISKSNPLVFLTKNYFAAGDGSKKNPFQIATLGQLKEIVRYPNAYYKQTKDLNYNYESVGGFFSNDLPFNGLYDGNNKTISCISANTPLFNCVGEKGQIKNLNMKKCNVISEKNSILCETNHGKIVNCKISGTLSGEIRYVGLVAADNYGTVSGCRASGTISAQITVMGSVYAGGIVGVNETSGKIVSCSSAASVQIKSSWWETYPRAGGICGYNNGLIVDSAASGTVLSEGGYGAYGGITGQNNGQITSCSYSGSSQVEISGTGSGGIA